MSLTSFFQAVPVTTAPTVSGYRYKKMGQSPSVGAAPIDPNPSNANSVAYNPLETLSQGALSRVTPSLLRKFTYVHIFNKAVQAWQPYEVRVNAQGFDGSELGGGYVPGFCSFLPFAQWWEQFMPGKHLFLEKAGAVGQSIDVFMANYGNGQDNVFHQVANTLWIPAENQLPAYAASLGVTDMQVLGYEWTHGEAENTNTVSQYNAKLQQLLLTDLAPYWPRTGTDILVITPTIYSLAVTIANAVNAQKAIFIANTPRAVTHPTDQVTLLRDNVHWGSNGMWMIGYYYLPEALGLSAVRDKYFFKNYAKATGTTVNKWLDTGGAYNDIVAVPGLVPALVTDSASNNLVFTVSSGSRAKLVAATFGGFQQVDNTEKTITIAVQQPATTAPQFLLENNRYSVSPGFSSGAVGSLNAYIGGQQDTSKLTVLTLELTRTSTTDSDGKGVLTLYRNNLLVASGPCSMSRIDGDGLAFLSPFNETYANQASQAGTFFAAFIAYPGVSAARRNAEYSDLTTQLLIGSTMSLATPAPTPTDGEPTGPYADAVLAPTETGLTLSNGVVRAPTTIQTTYATGLFTAFLAPNMSGAVSTQFVDESCLGSTLSLNTDPKRVLTGYSWQVSRDSGSGYQVNPAYNGVPVGTPFPIEMGLHTRGVRIGATGVVRIQKSTDSTGTSWVPVSTAGFQFQQETKAALYPVVALATPGNVLYGPRSQSMSPSTIPLPNSGLLTLNSPLSPSTTRGGFANFGTAGISTSGGFAISGFFNLSQLLESDTIIGCQGFDGSPNEAFLFDVVKSSGKLYTRVRTTNAQYAGPDEPSRPVFPLGQENFVFMETLPSGGRLFLNDMSEAAAIPFAVPGTLPQVSTDFLIGAGRKDDGTPAFSMIGSARDVSFAMRTAFTTEQERLALKAGTALLSGTTRFSTLRRQYTNDTLSPDTVSTSNPVIILDGGGL
jgi:hypothetical protein